MVEGAADAPISAPKCVIRGGVDDSLDDSTGTPLGAGRLPAEALVGVVETALARALTLAAEAGRWEIAAQLADELAARQRAREGRSEGTQRKGDGDTKARA